jgi:hypothetical protein
MIAAKGMIARIRRLAKMTKNLTKEGERITTAETPLMPLERRPYLLAIQQMIAGLVEAKVVLVKALPRIEKAEANLNDNR